MKASWPFLSELLRRRRGSQPSPCACLMSYAPTTYAFLAGRVPSGAPSPRPPIHTCSYTQCKTQKSGWPQAQPGSPLTLHHECLWSWQTILLTAGCPLFSQDATCHHLKQHHPQTWPCSSFSIILP